MVDVVNPVNILSPNVGHHFISIASFPWMDPVNGGRRQESIINIVLQTKTLGDRKLLMLEGDIRLDSHGHTTAQRFKLEALTITALVLHGPQDPARASELHPIRGDSMSPTCSEYAQQICTTVFTLNPSPTSLGHIQFITSTCRTHIGSSVSADQQQLNPTTDGTVWCRKVEDPVERTFGGRLGIFSAGFHDCVTEHSGCSVDDPTSLSLTIKASFSDTRAWPFSKPTIHTMSVHYPTWPALDEQPYAGEQIYTVYNTNFSGREVKVIQSTRSPLAIDELPQDISYNVEVHRTRGSRIMKRKLYSAMYIVGGTLKVVGKHIRRPSRFLDMMIDREATRSTSNT